MFCYVMLDFPRPPPYNSPNDAIPATVARKHPNRFSPKGGRHAEGHASRITHHSATPCNTLQHSRITLHRFASLCNTPVASLPSSKPLPHQHLRIVRLRNASFCTTFAVPPSSLLPPFVPSCLRAFVPWVAAKARAVLFVAALPPRPFASPPGRLICATSCDIRNTPCRTPAFYSTPCLIYTYASTNLHVCDICDIREFALSSLIHPLPSSAKTSSPLSCSSYQTRQAPLRNEPKPRSPHLLVPLSSSPPGPHWVCR
jgi:hypothetical protein